MTLRLGARNASFGWHKTVTTQCLKISLPRVEIRVEAAAAAVVDKGVGDGAAAVVDVDVGEIYFELTSAVASAVPTASAAGVGSLPRTEAPVGYCKSSWGTEI